jgi:hypothetical protein
MIVTPTLIMALSLTINPIRKQKRTRRKLKQKVISKKRRKVGEKALTNPIPNPDPYSYSLTTY